MFRISAFYGNARVSTVIRAEDIESAMISGELAYPEAGLIVCESL